MSVPLPYSESKNELGFSISLNIPTNLFISFPELISWNGIHFRKKEKFHVTLIHTSQETAEKVSELFTRFAAEHPIKLTSFQNDFRSPTLNAEQTIVICCSVSNLEALFSAVHEELGLTVPLQPTHVTLYIKNHIGLYIDTKEQMEALPEVHMPELSAALPVL